MASKKKTRKPTVGRSYVPMNGERGGAKYGIRPIEPTGGGTIGGLISSSGQGQMNV